MKYLPFASETQLRTAVTQFVQQLNIPNLGRKAKNYVDLNNLRAYIAVHSDGRAALPILPVVETLLTATQKSRLVTEDDLVAGGWFNSEIDVKRASRATPELAIEQNLDVNRLVEGASLEVVPSTVSFISRHKWKIATASVGAAAAGYFLLHYLV